MTPREIAAYADDVLAALESRGWRGEPACQILQIALKEKLRQEGNKGTL